MRKLALLLAVVIAIAPCAALAQSSAPTTQQLNALQLRLNEQQQQLQQLQAQPSTQPQRAELRRLQQQLEKQRLQLQQLQRQQRSCRPPGPC